MLAFICVGMIINVLPWLPLRGKHSSYGKIIRSALVKALSEGNNEVNMVHTFLLPVKY